MGKAARKRLKTDLRLTWKSVEKWHEKYRYPALSSYGPNTCPLCGKYYVYGYEAGSCRRCPIALDTGEPMCRGTPYERVEASIMTIEGSTKKVLRPLILKEIEYLVDLACKLGERLMSEKGEQS